jgi:hypothetical protein
VDVLDSINDDFVSSSVLNVMVLVNYSTLGLIEYVRVAVVVVVSHSAHKWHIEQ